MKIFDQAAARTGLRDHEAAAAGFDPVTVASEADDHKAYYPGSHRITMRVTGDRATGRLLGMQLFGHKNAEIAKRIDIAATAIFHGMTVEAVSDLDLSYTPPLGSPWDAVQMGAQAWTRAIQRLTRSTIFTQRNTMSGHTQPGPRPPRATPATGRRRRDHPPRPSRLQQHDHHQHHRQRPPPASAPAATPATLTGSGSTFDAPFFTAGLRQIPAAAPRRDHQLLRRGQQRRHRRVQRRAGRTSAPPTCP